MVDTTGAFLRFRMSKAVLDLRAPAIDRFDGSRVRFTDGTNCAPDAVICATGYRPGLFPWAVQPCRESRMRAAAAYMRTGHAGVNS